jgi:hypothetical protein
LKIKTDTMDWSVVSAVNNDAILQSNLLKSPDLSTASEVILQRGFSSAALAYNDALDKAATSLVVLAHQDVYFPSGWLHKVSEAVTRISETDPQWAVLGVWGVTTSGDRAGHVYCAGLRKELGRKFDGGAAVRTLDEAVLIVRAPSSLRFDPGLKGFHLYGTDLCLTAASHGLGCYAISAYCVHNTNGYKLLPAQFWRNCLYLRSKWRSQLPITTPCIDITASRWPMIHWNAKCLVNLLLGRVHPGQRIEDPTMLCGNRSDI